ncbi:arogenate dehydrogenase 2, chloroplastic-like isoform X2 [Phoenix dactylifera]|uniref:Arogenate dehydrogenase 2, chloroplastic-like isoform X2 n=1 Tax=Phoenix dactylifera TaxID=42345 RepID=A0A8B9AR58_PHODC|nr:arogenate dehydrogenase 2, chloroplastic-like isoform X2 [Phoenix dactylifera]
MASSSSSTPLPNGPLKIAIIGFGPFAQFLAKTFVKQGHILTATSRSDYSLLCSQLGITFFRDMDDLMEAGGQVILLCTSILSLGDVIRSIPMGRLRMPLLFVDVLSVKEYPRDLLLRVLPEESDVLCTHPMFGPESGKEGWNGLPLVYEKVRIRDHALCDNYLGIFQAEGCRMVEMSCQEHDEMAAKSQFLAHTFGRDGNQAHTNGHKRLPSTSSTGNNNLIPSRLADSSF